jgi:hypothetical protein
MLCQAMSDAGDALILAVLDQLLRVGVLDGEDADEIAERLEKEGQGEAAHWARAALVQAIVAPERVREVPDARELFRIVRPDGGNSG